MSGEGSVFEGRTLEDAVRKGLDTLGLSRAEVTIAVVEEGSGGFLGIGARPYRVRVVARPGGAIAERGERPARSRRGPARAEGRRPRPERGRGSRERDREEPRDRGGRRQAREEERGRPPAATREGGRGEDGHEPRRRGRRGGRGRTGAAPGVGATAPRGAGQRPEREPSDAGAGRRAPAVATEREGGGLAGGELAAEAKRLTEGLLRHMDFQGTVTATAEEDRAEVAIHLGESEDLLTGRKGEVRQALQHILTLMINRGGGTRCHLQLEINDFWQRREKELHDLALSLAEQALESGGEVATEYLNAQERRVVHMALKEDGRVKTYALGTGLIKRVAVAPADFAEGSKTDR